MTLLLLRHSRDSHRPSWLAWRFTVRNLFQIVTAAFFVVVSTLAALKVDSVGYTIWARVGFGLAALSYMSLLVAPARRWVRVCSVAAPLLAIGLRVNDLLMADPIRPTGIAVWGLLLFIYYRVAPTLLPPPLSNGERRRWLDENGA